MTPIDRFERVLPAALADLGEMHTPDYLTDILGRTARTPQRPAWASPERWLPMPAPFSPRFVAALLVAALIVAVAGFMVAGSGGAGPVPAPSPSPSPSAALTTSPPPSLSPVAAATGAVPAAWLGRWMSGPRPLAGLDAKAGTSLSFDTDTVALSPANQNDATRLKATAATGDPGQLVLTGWARVDPCAAEDIGQYRVELSPTGRTLTITASVPDTCPDREASVVGTWDRMGCKDPNDNCLGDLEAGTHASQFFTPRLAAGATWSPIHGQLTFRVPDGWAMTSDYPRTFNLETSEWYSTSLGSTQTDVDGIYMRAQPGAVVESSICDPTLDPAIGTRAADLAAYAAGHPGLDASAPQDVTIGSLRGSMVDARLRPEAAGDCGGVALFASLDESDGWTWSVIDGEEHRFIFVDLDATSTVLIDIATDQGDMATLREAAMPIVETYTFPE
jgi:hypothetical protein